MRLFENTNINFLGKRKIFYIVSLVFIICGFVTLFLFGIPVGIDFQGGTEVQLKFENSVEIGNIRSIMDNAGFSGMEIKTMGTDKEILLRTPLQAEGQIIADRIREAIDKALPDNKYEVLRIDKVGPKIGAELRTNAFFAVIFSLIGILVYLSFRFQLIYAVSAVIGLFHDVFITIAAIAISSALFPSLGLEFGQTMLAAFLTLIGFSVNDTVVVFDRIRENIKLYKNEDIEIVMNRSINATLSRTVITSGLVFLTVFVLFLFGGEVLRSFSFTFGVGVIIGTYSSVFVSGAIVVDWKHKLMKKSGEKVLKPAFKK